jgi:hypothetical protein
VQSKMTQAQLRAYVVANRQDNEAFRLWSDRATANAPKTIYPPVSLEEAERIIRSKIEAQNPGFLADCEANSQPCSRTELEAMSRAELRAYLIAHPKHAEAFHFYIDTAQPTSPLYPPVTSVEAMEQILRESDQEKPRLPQLVPPYGGFPGFLIFWAIGGD